jgi:hypothetical protein
MSTTAEQQTIRSVAVNDKTDICRNKKEVNNVT